MRNLMWIGNMIIFLHIPAGWSQVIFETPLSLRNANYRIDVILDVTNKKIQGHETLTWRNITRDRVKELQFHLYMNAFKNNRSTFFREQGGRTGKIGKEKKETAWALLPDLLIVDGGKGQLAAAQEVLDSYGLRDEVPIAALAKREEEIFIPEKGEPVVLPDRSQALYLVQRVRDEAHRFANEGHRKRRARVGVASILDGIPGVGPKRRQTLLAHFGSLDELRRATAEEIGSVPGIPIDVAESIKAHLD